MVEFNDALLETIKFIQVEIQKIDPHAFKSRRWRLLEDEEDIRDSEMSDRMFQVAMAEAPSEPLMVGSNTQDYNELINVTICYEYHRTQKLNAKRDHKVIRNHFINVDVSELNSYELHYFRVDEEEFQIDSEKNALYMTVPITARYTVTN